MEKGKGKQVMGNEVLGKEGLYPVKPYQRGEGFPYAPVDWPNPGDTWYWSVGSRTTPTGYYKDRYIYPPKRLHVQDPNIRFDSKAAIKRYISSQFPNADLNKFFASFSWEVPTMKHHCGKDLFPQVSPNKNDSKRRKETPSNSKRTKKARQAMSQAFPRRRTRQSYKIPAQANIKYDGSVIDLTDDSESDGSGHSIHCSEPPIDDSTRDGSGYTKCGSEPPIDTKGVGPDQSVGPSCNAVNAFEPPNAPKTKEFHAQFCEDDVDKCLKSLEHTLFQHNYEAQVQTPLSHVDSDMAEEMSSYHKKLSSILALDFSCWLSSKYLKEISFLVEKLVTDPILTADQLLKLKSVKEIPKVGEFFLHAKGIVEQANKFFGDLQAMKDKLSSIKREFNELKRGVGELQSQIDSKSSLVQEIDEQIAQLQSRQVELARELESKNEVKVQRIAEQEIMAKSLSAVIQNIQEVSAKIPAWNMEKKNAEERMDEILARYVHLKGFSFEKPGASCASYAPPYVASSTTQVPSYSACPLTSAPPDNVHARAYLATNLAYPSYPPYPVAYPPPPHFSYPPSTYPPPAYPPRLAYPLPPHLPPLGMCPGSPYPPPPSPPGTSSGLQSGTDRS